MNTEFTIAMPWYDSTGKLRCSLVVGGEEYDFFVSNQDDCEGEIPHVVEFHPQDQFCTLHGPVTRDVQTALRRVVSPPHKEHGGFWGHYPDHPVGDWQDEVAAGNTRLGYWEWVGVQLELA